MLSYIEFFIVLNASSTLSLVQAMGTLSEEFLIKYGIKIRCVLALILFSLYLAPLTHDNPETDTSCRYEGGLFKVSWLRSRRLTRNISQIIQYTGVSADLRHSKEELQRSVNKSMFYNFIWPENKYQANHSQSQIPSYQILILPHMITGFAFSEI